MKKVFIGLLILILTLGLSIAFIFIAFEDRIVEKFKKQIIDKTDININFSKVHLSLFKNFPYCSFVLNDAYVLYTSNEHSDTLITSKKVSFKINTINLFRSIYEFSEIEFSDGTINIKSEKVSLLFQNKDSNKSSNSYIIKTERIKIIHCLVKYSCGKNITLSFHLRNIVGSGTFFPNAFDIRLNCNVDSLACRFNNYSFKNTTPVFISTKVKEKNDVLFSETGLINLKTIKLGFAFNYSFKNDSLQVSLSSQSISFKELKRNIQRDILPFVNKGDFSFESYYGANFNDFNSQKLTVRYKLKNLSFSFDKNIFLSNLNGTSFFLNNFKKNISDISNFSINYSGLSFSGDARIVNFPKPHILINSKVYKTKDLYINKDLIIKGTIKGDLKLLANISDIYKLNYNTLTIIKLYSAINMSDLTIDKFDIIKKLAGDIRLDENRLTFTGGGKLLSSSFIGSLEIPDFLNVLIHKKNPSPVISVEVDRINLDSILSINKNSTSAKYPNNYHLSTKIKKLIYRGSEVNNLSLCVNYKNPKFTCDRFSMNAFSGNLTGNFSSSINEDTKISVLFENIDINRLFITFNNFDQQVVTSENISGSLSGKANIAYKLEKTGVINSSSIKLSSNLIVENGKLRNLNQFEKLSKFLNLEEVESVNFKTLENKINIEDGIVTIPSMRISSNALDFDLAGKHYFSGDFNYLVKINLKEILTKKYLKNNKYNSGYESDNHNGLNLFFRLIGSSDNYNFILDKKNSFLELTNSIKEDGPSFKSMIKEEFKKSKKDKSFKDSIGLEIINKIDSVGNKNKKVPFKIEWDEIDSTKIF
ncbi:MAG: hypothetical protein HOO91_12070 [Bacteroidales bacterium]|nr:hypothetical protein [Bacteroidales bacterium]